MFELRTRLTSACQATDCKGRDMEITGHCLVRFAVLLCLALLAVQPLAAAPLESRMDAFVVKRDKDGKETLKPGAAVVPGDVLEYQLVYRNAGKQALNGIEVTGPVPAKTQFVPGSARPEGAREVLVSIDGGKTFEPEPVKRVRRLPNGREETYVVPPEEYTHLRWRLGGALAAGAEKRFRYRVKVD